MHGKLTESMGTNQTAEIPTFMVYRTNPVPTKGVNTFKPIAMYQTIGKEKLLPGVMIFNAGTDLNPVFQVCELNSVKERNEKDGSGMETSTDLEFLLRQYFCQSTDQDFNNRKVAEVRDILSKIKLPEE